MNGREYRHRRMASQLVAVFAVVIGALVTTALWQAAQHDLLVFFVGGLMYFLAAGTLLWLVDHRFGSRL